MLKEFIEEKKVWYGVKLPESQVKWLRKMRQYPNKRNFRVGEFIAKAIQEYRNKLESGE